MDRLNFSHVQANLRHWKTWQEEGHTSISAPCLEKYKVTLKGKLSSLGTIKSCSLSLYTIREAQSLTAYLSPVREGGKLSVISWQLSSLPPPAVLLSEPQLLPGLLQQWQEFLL